MFYGLRLLSGGNKDARGMLSFCRSSEKVRLLARWIILVDECTEEPHDARPKEADSFTVLRR